MFRGRGHDPHEDVAEERPGLLEVPDPAAARQLGQDRLRVAADPEPQLLEAAVVGYQCHPRRPVEPRTVAFEADVGVSSPY